MGAKKTNPEDSKDRQDYDTPWKKVLETYFKEFVHFFFPDMADDIDCSPGYEFLNKELRQVAKDAELGRRYADSLASVTRKGGQEEWVMIHAEIQGRTMISHRQASRLQRRVRLAGRIDKPVRGRRHGAFEGRRNRRRPKKSLPMEAFSGQKALQNGLRQAGRDPSFRIHRLGHDTAPCTWKSGFGTKSTKWKGM